VGERIYRGCSLRAILIGLVLAAFMGIAIPWGDMVIKGSQMGVWNTNPGAIFLFFVVVGICNTLVGFIHRRAALDSGELAVIYIMLLIANTLPARGFAAYVPAVATGAFYYASPENNWKELVLPHVPEWATVQDEAAVRHYYEGAEAGQGVPWDIWLGPLLYWLLFALSLYLVMMSISVILRRQWVERERLVYPMMQLPQHMLREDEQGRKNFFRSSAMWPCWVSRI
jgi:hypothetical protein